MIEVIFKHAEKVKQKESRLKSVIVTLGERGVIIAEKGGEGIQFKKYESIKIESKTVKSVVGAGDSFLAGYVYGLSKGEKEEICVKYG